MGEFDIFHRGSFIHLTSDQCLRAFHSITALPIIFLSIPSFTLISPVPCQILPPLHHPPPRPPLLHPLCTTPPHPPRITRPSPPSSPTRPAHLSRQPQLSTSVRTTNISARPLCAASHFHSPAPAAGPTTESISSAAGTCLRPRYLCWCSAKRPRRKRDRK